MRPNEPPRVNPLNAAACVACPVPPLNRGTGFVKFETESTVGTDAMPPKSPAIRIKPGAEFIAHGTDADIFVGFRLSAWNAMVNVVAGAAGKTRNRYHLRPDWQEAAVHVMFASVFIAVVGSSWWRKIGFWMSLVLSSAIHMFVVHAWIQRVGNLHGQGKIAILLGFVLFFAVYGFVWLLRRNFYGTEARDET